MNDPGFGIAPPHYRLPAAARVDSVTLQVSDLTRSEAYYTTVLGLVAMARDADGTALGAPGGGTPLVYLVSRSGIRPVDPGTRLGLYHFALLLPDRAALGRFAQHVRSLGKYMGMADHLVSEALYLTDPDGLGIEVYADRPRTRWEREGNQLVMTTEPLDLDDLTAAGGAEAFDGFPADTVVGHVHLYVGDLVEAERFYHTALGFDKTVWSYPGALFLSAGGYHHHLGTNIWAGPVPPAGEDDARLLKWTVALPEAEDVRSAAASVASEGFEVSPGGDGTSVTMRDPWGTAVEMQASPARMQETTAGR